MSSCDESLSGRVFLWYRLWLMMIPVAEASLSLCPVLPVNGLLEDKTKSPCGRGSIVVCTERDCRLVVPFGCNVV